MPEKTGAIPDETRTNRADTVKAEAVARRRRYVPAPSPPGLLSLTPTKWEMLRYLAELRFLSLPQLARLCCPAGRRDLSERSARWHLRVLFDAGLVDVLPVSRAALAPPGTKNDASLLHGSAPNVYAPTRDGLRLLVRAGHLGEEHTQRSAPAYGPRNALFLAHELLVRDVRVWLEDCARAGGHGVERWEDGEAAAIPLGKPGASRSVRPDAWFAYRMGQVVLVGLVETDRGTERGDRRWKEKLEAYAALYAGTALREATGYVNARVLVICPNAQRRDGLARLIPQLSETLAERFWLAEWGALEAADLWLPLWRRFADPTLCPLIQW